jgi:hypothetical protein
MVPGTYAYTSMVRRSSSAYQDSIRRGRGMLTLTHASLATVSQLFEYKASGFDLPDFPGYSPDQWGIKAHNRPWIESKGRFREGQRIAEVGGAYSRLPEYLSEKYQVEPWVIDDFGLEADESLWSRWGDPHELPSRHPSIHYLFRRMGDYSTQIPGGHFDRIFTVSTLEHIPNAERLDVLRDIHRCLGPGGMELHSIDVSVPRLKVLIAQWIAGRVPALRVLDRRLQHDVDAWLSLFRASGVRLAAPAPSLFRLLDRSTLVESPDVVYRFYPPNDAPKPYRPAASLLLVIEDI